MPGPKYGEFKFPSSAGFHDHQKEALSEAGKTLRMARGGGVKEIEAGWILRSATRCRYCSITQSVRRGDWGGGWGRDPLPCGRRRVSCAHLLLQHHPRAARIRSPPVRRSGMCHAALPIDELR